MRIPLFAERSMRAGLPGPRGAGGRNAIEWRSRAERHLDAAGAVGVQSDFWMRPMEAVSNVYACFFAK